MGVTDLLARLGPVADHLPVLLVVVPLMAAPISALLGLIQRRPLPWIWATLVAWLTFGMSALLLGQVMTSGTVSYPLGGWAPPLGIEYRVDLANAYVLFIVTSIGAVVMPYAKASVDLEIEGDKHHLFYAALLLCLTGLLGITVTGDAFNVFVFLEISSLSTYGLIAMGRGPRALTSAFRYLVMGTIGGTFILIGIGLMYMMTGTLNMSELVVMLPAVSGSRTIQAALAFLTVGASIKLALFPLHLWLPNAYTYSPSAVSAFLAATATKVSFYVLARVFFTFFGVALVFGTMRVDAVLMPIALLAIYSGSLVAIFQKNAKRLLAYSSVAQIGYMVLGLSMVGWDGTQATGLNGLTGGLVHLFNHAVMKGGMFLALGAVFYRIGSVNLDDMAGIGKRMPLTMLAFTFGGLGLIGVPMTAGFISKWYLVLGALEMERHGGLVVGAMLISSLLAVVYVWRVIEVAYFREPTGAAKKATDPPALMLVPTWLLIGASIYFGLQTELTGDVARAAAASLMGVSP
ncbi:MAG: monovalent cation/H+ antiporter subunit D family protein [Alphaproteobacteria bacterium]|nr:monovalent cation/H+ antiporter subunit D family protein [Alphaproteobacteria bacterium]